MRDLSGRSGVLLKRMRELMAAPLSSMERLDGSSARIRQQHGGRGAARFDVMRAAGVLELYSTDRRSEQDACIWPMKMGQGLVGTSRRPSANQSIFPKPSRIRPSAMPRGRRDPIFLRSACRFSARPFARCYRCAEQASRTYPRSRRWKAIETTAMVLAR